MIYMMNKIRLLVVALIGPALLAAAVIAGEGEAGNQSALAHGVGVRALALGGAYVSLANDADAVTWNPAWLAHLERHSFSATYVEFVEGTEIQNASWGNYFDGLGGIGLSFSRLGTNEFPSVINWVTQPGNIEYSASITTLAAAFNVSDGLSVGVSGKALYESLFGANDYSFGLDAAAAYRRAKFSAGLLVRDLLATDIELTSVGQSIPISAQLGLSISDWEFSEFISATAAVDVELIEERGAVLHSGIEGVLGDAVAVRIGLTGDDLTFGAGFIFNNLTLDYAYRSLDNLRDSHRFGLSLTFGKTLEDRRAVSRARHEALGRSYAESDRQRRAGESYNRANDYVSAGQLDSAAVSYQITLSLDSAYMDAGQRLKDVETQIAERDAQLAAETARGAGLDSLALSQLASRLTLDLAEELAGQTRYRAALSMLSAALESDPLNDTLNEAISKITGAQQSWKSGQSRSARGAMQSGSYQKALELYADLLREFPDDRATQSVLAALGSRLRVSDMLSEARARFEEEDYDAARLTAENILLIESANSAAQDLLELIKQASASPSDLDALWDDPADAQAMSQALEFVRAAELQQALDIFDRLLEKYPDNQELAKNKRQIELRLSGGQ